VLGNKRRLVIVFLLISFGGFAIFDYLDISFDMFGEIIIFGSRSTLGCRKKAPYDTRSLAR
jgi:hypothetical protein